jgi:hypothetical protein
MARNDLLEKIQEAGFDSLDSFVKTNLHYLPENKQKLFYTVSGSDKNYQETYHKDKK